MQKIINHWQAQFYTPALQIILLVYFIIVSIKHRKKFKQLRYFPVYGFVLLLDVLAQYWYYIVLDANHNVDLSWGLSTYLDYFFTLLELIIFSNFYYQLTQFPIVRKIILILNFFFTPFYVFMGIKDKYFYEGVSAATQTIVYTVEGIILLFLCSLYFIELFKKLPIVNLKNEPVFWVSTGLLFFMACTLPYSLLQNNIMKNYSESFFTTSYSIFHVFYILLFLMIIRAYLCKPVEVI